MAKLNIKWPKFTEKTHEGAPAARINALQQLRRSVLACMLWESGFYESGEDVAERIKSLVAECKPDDVAALAVEARTKQKLRHAPLLLARELARHPKLYGGIAAQTICDVVQRADELAEFLALYWADGKQPLSKQVKTGLACAFNKFDEYALAKYNRDSTIKLRDVLFMVHAKPKDEAQAALWKRLIDNQLAAPDTWEVALSGGANKRETWERLIKERKLGALAFLRNLRNMQQAGVSESAIFAGLDEMKTERVLPFRFISAARYAPQWESKIEPAMLKCLAGREKLPGKTVLLIDVSGSMDSAISAKSDLQRIDAANGLAILARELCDEVAVYSFSEKLVRVPDRRGFALRDAVHNSQPHSGTLLGRAVEQINTKESYTRLIVLTDEQSHDVVPNPKALGYMVNIATDKNGVGYGAWTHIDGWSEAVFDYIGESEKSAGE